MKKIALTLISLLAAAVCLSAQETEEAAPVWHSNEIEVSYGLVTAPDVIYSLGAALGTAFTLGSATVDKFHCYGGVTVGYFHWFNKMLAVGCEGTAEEICLSFKGSNSSSSSTSSDSDALNTCISLMPSVKGRWVTKPHFGLYSKAAIGAIMIYKGAHETTDSNGTTTTTEAACSVTAMAQLSPLGLEFGGLQWKGFAEFGVGAQGCAQLGVRYSF